MYFAYQERFKALQEDAAEKEKRLRSNRVLSSRENAHDLGGHTEEEGGRYRNFPSVLSSQMLITITSVVSLDYFYGINALETKQEGKAKDAKNAGGIGDPRNAVDPNVDPNVDPYDPKDDAHKLILDVAKSLNNEHHEVPELTADQVINLKIGDFVAAKTNFPCISDAHEEYHRGRITEVRFDKIDDEYGRRPVQKARVFFVVSFCPRRNTFRRRPNSSGIPSGDGFNSRRREWHSPCREWHSPRRE